MKYIFSIIILMIIVSCGSKGPQIVEPDCVADKVTYFSENQACDADAWIREYEFQSEVVYVFNHGNCIDDGAAAVVNYDCDTLGFMGGIGGVTKINGKDFYENAEFVRTLFEN